MTNRTASQGDIHAYLDGELTAAEQQRFEELAATDPVLKETLAAYRRTEGRLRSEFDAVAREAIPEAMLATVLLHRPAARRRYLAAIAAGLALFLLGGAGGWALQGSSRIAPDAHMPGALALTAHRVYAAEVRHPVEVGVDERDHLVAWLSKRMGQQLSTPDLTAAGYRLIGGRLLPGEDSAAAQFMYENDARERITLYVSRNLEGGQTAFKLSGNGDLRTFYWLDGAFGYAITGSIDEAALLKLAHSAYDQLTGPAAEPQHRT
jgi:anti-sigma factor RsiW